jgi:hypothetical protein
MWWFFFFLKSGSPTENVVEVYSTKKNTWSHVPPSSYGLGLQRLHNAALETFYCSQTVHWCSKSWYERTAGKDCSIYNWELKQYTTFYNQIREGNSEYLTGFSKSSLMEWISEYFINHPLLWECHNLVTKGSAKCQVNEFIRNSNLD